MLNGAMYIERTIRWAPLLTFCCRRQAMPMLPNECFAGSESGDNVRCRLGLSKSPSAWAPRPELIAH